MGMEIPLVIYSHIEFFWIFYTYKNLHIEPFNYTIDRRESSILPILITELLTLVGRKSKQTLFTLLLPILMSLPLNHPPYLLLLKFVIKLFNCENVGLSK